MFCPNCGKADQTVDTYCRGCGEFLADLSNPFSLFSRLLGINTPAKQITVNLIINLVTAGVSILLVAFLNGYFDGRAARTSEAAPPIVYLVYVFLGLVAAWQFLSFVLNLKLKARFQGARKTVVSDSSKAEEFAEARQRLPEADFENAVPHRVIEKETEIFEKPRRG